MAKRGTVDYGLDLPLQRTAPCTSQNRLSRFCPRTEVFLPSNPLCSLGLSAGSSGIHRAGWGLHRWNVPPTTDGAYLPQRFPPSLPSFCASCLVPHCSLTSVAVSLLSSS